MHDRGKAILVRTALAFLAVQLGYWLIASPFVFAAPPPLPDGIEVSAPQYAKLASPDPAPLARADFKATELPIEDCCDPGYRAVRMTFEHPQGVAPLGIVPVIGADNYRMLVNGSLIYGEGSIWPTAWSRSRWRPTRIWSAPSPAPTPATPRRWRSATS